MAIDTKFRELEPSMWKAFDRKYSYCIRLWNTTMKNWFRHHLENFISFPLIYRFAGIRRVLTELEADNWKTPLKLYGNLKDSQLQQNSSSSFIISRFFEQQSFTRHIKWCLDETGESFIPVRHAYT